MRDKSIKYLNFYESLTIIVFILNNHKINLLIVLPFKMKIKNQQSDEFFSKYLSTTFEIGEPPQNIEADINFQESDFHLTYTRKYIPLLYNKTKSNTYINTTLYRITTKNFISGCRANETFFFYNDENLKNKQKYMNVPFFMSTNMDKLFAAILGFELNGMGARGFVGNLKYGRAINSYTWTLKYNNIEEGLLIIGEEPHIYNNTYDENKLKYTKLYMYKNLFSWSISFENIIIGELINRKNIISLIRPDIKGLIAPKEYLENIKAIYLDKYLNENICKINEIYEKNISNNDYDYNDDQKMKFYKIECDKTKFSINDINNFLILKFVNIPLNYSFLFNGKDLFIENNEKYIFQIYFGDIKYWYFGSLFLYKYQLIFNEDNKLIGFYTGMKKEKISDKNDYIFKIILIIIFLIFGLFIFFVLFKEIRLLNRNKKYAKELEEDFSYKKNDMIREIKNLKNDDNYLFKKND